MLKSALDKYPDLAAIHYSLGLLKVRMGEHEEAMVYLENAARYDPNDPHYIYVYAIGLNSQNQAREALKVLKNAATQFPYDRNILYSLVTISMENGEMQEALIYVKKLVEYYPDDPNYKQALGVLSNN